jgi:hypothetical protein
MTDITTPEPGTELTVKMTVITADAGESNHWGDNLKMAVKIEGIDGVHFGDLRLTVDNAGSWFTKKMANALHDIENPEPKSKLDPVDPTQMTVRQLRDYAKAQSIELPEKAKKAELVAAVKDATAEAKAA